MKKRVLAIILAMCVILTTLPTAVWADEPEDGGQVTEEVTYVDGQGNLQGPVSAIVVGANTTEWASGWYAVKGSVTIETRIEVSGAVNLILADGGSLKASRGISVTEGSSLTIYAQSEDADSMGQLIATGGSGEAGIGGNNEDGKKDSGKITINGGTVTATGGSEAAGIGGGKDGNGDTITINGGEVNANGGSQGAGIGGGHEGNGSNITINGGEVTAQGGSQGAGIGGGHRSNYGDHTIGNGTDITINGGIVTATGGIEAAGIGGGKDANGVNITITDGTVTATGGAGSNGESDSGGAGIGGGSGGAVEDGGHGKNITITGGTVVAKSGDPEDGYIQEGILPAIGAAPAFGGYVHATYGNAAGNSETTTCVEWTGNAKSDWSAWRWVKIQPMTLSLSVSPRSVDIKVGETATFTAALSARVADGGPAPSVSAPGGLSARVTPEGSAEVTTSGNTITLTARQAGAANLIVSAGSSSASAAVTIGKAALDELYGSVSMPFGRVDVTETVDLTGIIPDNAGGTPAFTVRSASYNGLTSAKIDQNNPGLLILTASNVPENTADDIVTVDVADMGNYENGVITITVSYTDPGEDGPGGNTPGGNTPGDSGSGGGGSDDSGGGDSASSEPPAGPGPGQTQGPGTDSPTLTFPDLEPDAWYQEAVDYVVSHSLMTGYDDGTFGPNNDLSRAMLAQILYNYAGGSDVTGSITFDDVPDGMWYADAVDWASAVGIIGGYGNGRFGPDDPITREQLAAILYRFAQSQGGGFTGDWVFQLDYTDADGISEYAREAVAWCTMNGILNGYGDSTLRPKGQATRAEAAAMLMQFLSRLTET